MSEPASEHPAAGLAAALSGIAATLIGLLRTRIELATVELEEERERIKTGIVFIIIATVFACFTLIALSALIVAGFWERGPLTALSIVVLVYALIALAAWLAARRRLHAENRPFAGTLSELERDVEALRRRS